jgi:hypothetical protein
MREEALEVLDSSAASLTTARDAVSSDDGGPSLSEGDKALASAEDALGQLTSKVGKK